jgi:hypothetical protein
MYPSATAQRVRPIVTMSIPTNTIASAENSGCAHGPTRTAGSWLWFLDWNFSDNPRLITNGGRVFAHGPLNIGTELPWNQTNARPYCRAGNRQFIAG